MMEENVVTEGMIWLQEKVPDAATIKSADTLIGTLEELRIVEDEILGDYKLPGTKKSIGDILGGLRGIGEETTILTGIAPREYGITSLETTLEDIAKVEYWIARKIGNPKKESIIKRIAVFFGTDRKKYKEKQLTGLVEIQLENVGRLEVLLDKSERQVKKLHDQIFDKQKELMDSVYFATVYKDQMNALNDYISELQERTAEIANITSVHKTKIRSLEVELNKRGSELDSRINECNEVIDWGNKVDSTYDKFTKIMSGYLGMIRGTSGRIRHIVQLLRDTNRMVAGIKDNQKIAQALTRSIVPICQGVLSGIGQISNSVRKFREQYESLEEMEIPYYISDLLDEPLSDIHQVQSKFERPRGLRGIHQKILRRGYKNYTGADFK